MTGSGIPTVSRRWLSLPPALFPGDHRFAVAPSSQSLRSVLGLKECGSVTFSTPVMNKCNSVSWVYRKALRGAPLFPGGCRSLLRCSQVITALLSLPPASR
jgi:hypothetical protein